MTNPLKFLLGGLLGLPGSSAGIMQADIGLNRILHNIRNGHWAACSCCHFGWFSMTLYSAIYFLLPILTNGGKIYSQKLANFPFGPNSWRGRNGCFYGYGRTTRHAEAFIICKRRI